MGEVLLDLALQVAAAVVVEQVPLVEREHEGAPGLEHEFDDAQVLGRQRFGDVEHDDRDLGALDALVEAGIRSTRSDAAAWLIHAGIESHRELFDKVYATVEEIRELRRRAQTIAEGLAVGSEGGAEDVPPEQASQGEQTEPPA